MQCFECGQDAEHEHHVVPKSLGGTKTVWLCTKCHGVIHDLKFCGRNLTKLALQRKKANGELVGRVPYGYDLADDGKTLMLNEKEQDVIKYMHDLRSFGMSFRAIASHLNKKLFCTKRNQGQWAYSTVKQILKRSA